MPNSSNECEVCRHPWNDHRFMTDLSVAGQGYGGRITCPIEGCGPCGLWGIDGEHVNEFEDYWRQKAADGADGN